MAEAQILKIERAPVPPPTGRVVLGFTDVQGSTELWETDPEAMRVGLALHDEVMRDSLAALRGYEVKTEGDAFMVAFARPVDAVRWALVAQEALMAASWPRALLTLGPARPGGGNRGLRVRMGLHIGEPDCRPDPVTGRMDYFGPMVNRAARIGAAGHGGQLVLSKVLWDEVHQDLGEDAVWEPLGEHRLKGLARPEALVQVLPASLADRTFPPLRTIDVARHRPYRGLSAFRAEDAKFFFGRDAEAERLTAKVKAHGMVTVTGASGAGKSSLLQAGVLPRLADHELIVVRPGSRPWSNLRAAVSAELDGDDPVEALRSAEPPVVLLVDQAEELLTLAAPGPERDRFVAALVALGQSVGEPTRVVLAIREDFFGPLARLEPLRPLYTRAVEVLTPPGPDALREALVRPLASFGARFDDATLPDEMVAAVDGKPAALAMLQFCADRLWDARDGTRITRAAYEAMGGVLGALAHHARSVEEAMTASEIAVARRILLRLVTPEGTRAPAGRQELLSAAGGGETAREVLDRLVSSRLLVVQDDGEGEATVELVHESLISRWPLLAGWLSEDRESIERLAALRTAVATWKGGGRSEDLLWRGAPLAELEGWLARSAPSLAADEEAFVGAARAAEERSRRTRRTVAGVAVALLVAVAVFSTVQWQRSEAARAQADAAAEELSHELLKSGAEAAVARSEYGKALPLALEAVEARPEDVAARRTLMRAVSAPGPDRYLYGHEVGLTAVSWAPDSDRFVTADLNGVLIARSSRGEQVWRVDSTVGPIAEVRWSPSGSRIAARTYDGRVALLDDAGGVRATFDEVPVAMAWSPDGAELALVDAGAVRRVDGDGETRRRQAIEGEVRSAAWGPPGLALGGADGTVWLVEEGSVRSLPAVPSGRRVDVLAWEPGRGRLLAGASFGHVAIYEDGQPREVGVVAEATNELVWHPAGGRFLAFSPDGPATLWSPEEGLVLTAAADWEASPAGVWMPDGDGWVSFGDDEWAYRHASDGRRIRDLKAHSRPVSAVRFAPDGSAAVLVSRDGLGSMWRSDLLPRRRPTLGPSQSAVSWSPGGERLVVSSAGEGDDLGLWMYELATGATAQVSDSRDLREATWSPAGDRVAWFSRSSSGDGGAWVGEVPSEGLPEGPLDAVSLRLDEGDVPRSLAWSPDGSLIAVGGLQGHGYLFDATGKRRFRLPMGQVPFEVWHVEFSPDSTQVFMSGRVMAAVRVAADLSDVAVFNGHDLSVTMVRPDPRGEVVATSGADATMRLWDYGGNQLAVFADHAAELKALAWSPDGERIATGDAAGTVIVRTRAGDVVGRFQGVLGSADVLRWTSDSRRLAVAARDKRVWVLGRDGELLMERQTRDTYAWQVGWSPDGAILAGVGWGGPVYLWPGDDATALAWARELAGSGPR